MPASRFINVETEHPAATRIAQYEIFLTRLIDAEGLALADLPAFATDPQQLQAMYRLMLRTRAFDQKAVALQRSGQLGTYASCLGQEAVGTAVGYSLAPQDIYMPSYREYAAQFARGVPMHQLLLYWAGDERGMNYPAGTPAHHDFPLSVPIASHVPQAVGVAYALKLKREPRVVLASCGDGATSKGDFAEAISAAGVWKLPLVFLVVNNQWAISMPRTRQTSASTLAQKALAGGIPGEQVDGNDVIAIRQVLERALARARDGGGPSLVEAITYRLHDHTTADDARRYRDERQVEQAWTQCPIKRLRAFMHKQGYWSEDDELRLQREAATDVEQAVQTYLQTAPLPPQAIFDHLYAELPASLAWQREEVRARGLQTDED